MQLVRFARQVSDLPLEVLKLLKFTERTRRDGKSNYPPKASQYVCPQKKEIPSPEEEVERSFRTDDL